MILNEYGQIVYNEWSKTPEIRSNVQLDEFVVMPNHVHGIIVITNNVSHTSDDQRNTRGRGVSHTPHDQPDTNDTPHDQSAPSNNKPDTYGGVPDTFGGVCDTFGGVCDTPLRSPSNTVGAIVRGYKSAVTKQLNQMGFTDSLWQRNYWENIIRDDQSYQRIATYIINNPMNWNNDKFYIAPNI